jgi:hypothetical protein
LDRLRRDAARPATGPVPASTAAVFFADRAELLAALAADWLGGELASRWWWRALGVSGTLDAVLRSWAGAPRYVPAALDVLGGRAIEFVRALPEPAALALAIDVATAFGAPWLRAPACATGPGNAAADPPTGSPHRHPPDPRTRPARRDPVAAPWDALVTTTGAVALPAGQQLLLGIGLALSRTPALVQRPGFWLAVQEWLTRPSTAVEARATTSPTERTEPVASVGPESRPGRHGGADGRGRSRPSAPSADPPGERRCEPDPRSDDDRPGGAPRHPRAPDAGVTTGGRHECRPSHPGPVPARARRVPAIPPSGRSEAPGPDPRRPAARAVSARRHRRAEIVDTHLGGLFYLLSVAQYLGLYGDFTAPTKPGIPLDPWDLVTLLGRRLLASPVPADPVWELLRDLAGRGKAEAPGRGFKPPADWRVPEGWLQPFAPTATWTWSAADGRLRLAHPAAFLVFDVRRTVERATAQLDRELAATFGGPPGDHLRRRSLPRGPRDPLARWAADLAAYVRARLAVALGHPPVPAARLLLRQRARVRTTPVHVDVEFSLATLPIEVRLAGLDRDPGWMPAAGRAIAFHFD